MRRSLEVESRMRAAFYIEQVRPQNLSSVFSLPEIWEFVWEDRYQVVVFITTSCMYFPRLNHIGQLGLAYVILQQQRDHELDRQIEAHERAVEAAAIDEQIERHWRGSRACSWEPRRQTMPWIPRDDASASS